MILLSQDIQKHTMQGKAAMPEQWTDTSLLWCLAHNAVQCCSADAAMHDTLQGSSYALLWFHELSSSCFTSLQFCHTLKEESVSSKAVPESDWLQCFSESCWPLREFLSQLEGHHPETDPRALQFLSLTNTAFIELLFSVWHLLFSTLVAFSNFFD